MYLALYRKYRPRVFDDVISQDHITTTLKNQVRTGQTAHAYLLTGSRGTGKTSCAKILAKAINCLSPVDGNPCLSCASCLEAEDGATDITEMDAASNNGVDDVRALRDEVMYLPVSMKKRVYIIDEVHMLSSSAFNALLKTLEEPPAHVVFILATTEMHKVPATILSRCQRFEFSRINVEDSAERLGKIAKLENVEITEEAAFLISRLSDGGMRDAVSLLDQCISVSSQITVQTVRDCAGVTDKSYLFKLIDAFESNDSAQALAILATLHAGSKDLSRLIEELILQYRNLMVIKLAPANTGLISALDDEIQQLKKLADGLSVNTIMRKITILQEYAKSLSTSKNSKIIVEMCFIKLSTPKLNHDIDALLDRVEKLENTIASIMPQRVSVPTLKDDTIAHESQPIENLSKPEVPATPIPEESKQAEASTNEMPAKATEENDFVPPWDEPPAGEAQESLPWQEPTPTTQALADDYPFPNEEEVVAFTPKPASKLEEGKVIPGWLDIIDGFSGYLGGLLYGSKAIYHGERVVLNTTRSIIKNHFEMNNDDFKKVKSAVENAVGHQVKLELAFDGVQTIKDENKLKAILDKAESLGYKIYYKK